MWKALELYLGFKPDFEKVEFQDDSDGKGPYISKWEYDKPKPTLVQLEALSEKVKVFEMLDAKIERANILIEKGRRAMGGSYEGWRQKLIGLKRRYLSEQKGLINE